MSIGSTVRMGAAILQFSSGWIEWNSILLIRPFSANWRRSIQSPSHSLSRLVSSHLVCRIELRQLPSFDRLDPIGQRTSSTGLTYCLLPVLLVGGLLFVWCSNVGWLVDWLASAHSAQLPSVERQIPTKTKAHGTVNYKTTNPCNLARLPYHSCMMRHNLQRFAPVFRNYLNFGHRNWVCRLIHDKWPEHGQFPHYA